MTEYLVLTEGEQLESLRTALRHAENEHFQRLLVVGSETTEPERDPELQRREAHMRALQAKYLELTGDDSS
jgi:hypothetical protein